jgi:hypothetical protein
LFIKEQKEEKFDKVMLLYIERNIKNGSIYICNIGIVSKINEALLPYTLKLENNVPPLLLHNMSQMLISMFMERVGYTALFLNSFAK